MADINRMEGMGSGSGMGGSVPVPDPTKLTTDAVSALEKQLKELFEQRFSHVNDLIREVHDQVAAQPLQRSENILHLKELVVEKFKGVDQQFASSATALASAFQANSQAALKAETAFTKQIDGLGTLINTALKSVDDKIDDLKARVTVVEAVKVGSAQNTDQSFKIVSALGVFVAIAIAIGSIVVGIAVR